MFLTKEYIQNNSSPHPVVEGGRFFILQIGSYTLSIVGGGLGLYGDFENDFEIAIFNSDGEFENIFLNSSDDIQPYSSIEEINNIIAKIPRI